MCMRRPSRPTEQKLRKEPMSEKEVNKALWKLARDLYNASKQQSTTKEN